MMLIQYSPIRREAASARILHPLQLLKAQSPRPCQFAHEIPGEEKPLLSTESSVCSLGPGEVKVTAALSLSLPDAVLASGTLGYRQLGGCWRSPRPQELCWPSTLGWGTPAQPIDELPSWTQISPLALAHQPRQAVFQRNQQEKEHVFLAVLLGFQNLPDFLTHAHTPVDPLHADSVIHRSSTAWSSTSGPQMC